MKKSTTILNTKPPDSSRVKIKFSGFKNSIYILPQDKAERLLKKVYKQKFDYLRLSGCDTDECVLRVEMKLIKIKPFS